MLRVSLSSRYLRPWEIPHIWCPGCGYGLLLKAFIAALEELNIDPSKLVVVAGIGCLGRIALYINAQTLHVTHGRAIPVATGVKLARPDLTVVVFGGDGDILAIGGNHLIHAARRNVEITVVMGNNLNYGMTGGQVAPTTPLEASTTTTPYGNIEPPFNAVQLAASAGATYVARWTVYHMNQLKNSLVKALSHKGFSFIEVVSACPTYYGRYNREKFGPKPAIGLFKWFKEASRIRKCSPEEAVITDSEIVIGEFVEEARPGFVEKIHEAASKLQKKLSEAGVRTFAPI